MILRKGMHTTVTAKLGLEEKNTLSMLCPCCGGAVLRGAVECGCGARFVGEPLDEKPIKVQRLGPAMTSVALLALVVTLSLVTTKWMALAAPLVIWSAWRALRLAKIDPDWYGGYRTALTTLTVTTIAGAGLATYGIAHIPQAIENYKLRRIAATEAAMYHYANALEDYKRTTGKGYPTNSQEFRKAIGEALPTDYWDQTLKYEGQPGKLADKADDPDNIRVSTTSFVLRSVGPDGVAGTDDDIIMRDGIIIRGADIKEQKLAQQPR